MRAYAHGSTWQYNSTVAQYRIIRLLHSYYFLGLELSETRPIKEMQNKDKGTYGLLLNEITLEGPWLTGDLLLVAGVRTKG